MRQVVFDIETTGFRYDQGDRIVEIGGVEMMRGAVTGRSFHAYVNPERDMPDGAYKVHGLSAEFLRRFPKFADARVASAFVEFVGDAELVAHNGAAFDLPFINAELANAGMERLANEITDTLLIARRKFPGSPASLDALCSRFNIDTSVRKRDGHGALLDSRLLAAVYIELTGGAQAGLDFAETVEARAQSDGPQARAVRQRPLPLKQTLSDEEAAAHAAFVERELGAKNLWGLTLKPPSGV
jgi:DNA polymerase-3 subunit epsilon